MAYQIFPAEWEPYVRERITALYKDILWSHECACRAKEHRFMMSAIFSLIGVIVLANWSLIAAGVFLLVIPTSLWLCGQALRTTADYYEHAREAERWDEMGVRPHELEEAIQYFAMNPQHQDIIREFLSALITTPHSPMDDAKVYCRDIGNVLTRFQDTPFIRDSPWFQLLVKMLTNMPGMPKDFRPPTVGGFFYTQ